ncbi:MAG: Nucleoside diphosphate kinase [Chlamydiae bacterium]|nr:Nucleoside diphosphate kinase [Chlamydiota bacterium]
MAKERTLSIIKPDAVIANHIGEIITIFEENGLIVLGCKMLHLTKEQAEHFYAIHTGKPFFEEIVQFMSSGPVVVICLEGEDAIEKNRDLMGVTDPKQAKEGTIRQRFGTNIGVNAVHGSDALPTAKEEVSFFFNDHELFSR